MKSNISSKRDAIIIGAVLGTIFFIMLYGVKVLNPRYDSWLFNNGDLTQHYIGWKAFRNSNWSFPKVGLMDGLTYPRQLSIVYMDSIPILAIFFKLFSTILPNHFQYFGLYGLLSYVIFGVVSSMILYKYTSNILILIMSNLIMLVSPIMMFRMFGHLALSSHWLILLGIYYLYFHKNSVNIVKNSIFWSFLLILSVSIHMYFVLMIFIILFGFLIDNYKINKSKISVIVILLSSIISTLMVMHILGAFDIKSLNTYGEPGSFSMNLNAFFNPLGLSSIIQTFPLTTSGQGEGFAYLGFGIIITLFISIYSNNILDYRSYFKDHTGNLFVIFFSVLLALGPIISINNHTLIKLPYPGLVLKFLDIFRANGRFIWIFYYMIVIFILKTTINNNSFKKSFYILLICIIFQYSDIFSHLKFIHNQNNEKIIYTSKLKSNFWNNIKNDHYKVMLFTDQSNASNLKYLWDFSDFAIENNIKLTDIYAARKDNNLIEEYRKKMLSDLISGKVLNDTLYIFPKSSIYINDSYKLNYYLVDNYVIGTVKQYPELKSYDFNSMEYESSDLNSSENSEILENKIILNSGGIQYGPYIKLKKGNYKIIISGENLEKSFFDVISNGNIIKIYSIKLNNNFIEYQISLDNDTESLEFRTINKSDLIKVSISSIKIKKLK